MTPGWIALGHWVLWSTAQTGAIVAVLAMVTGLAGRRLAPKWSAVLWLLVFLRLAIPWTPIVRAPLSPPIMPTHIASLFETHTPLLIVNQSASAMREGSRPTPLPNEWPLLAGALWALVVAALAIRTGRREWLFRRAIRKSGRPLHLGDAPRENMPEVWETTAVGAPAATGIWRPMILVPLGLRVALTPEEWQLVLRHELSHIHRRDIPVRWMMELATIVYWFNPFVWIARHCARQAQELAADDFVVADLAPAERLSYGHVLLTVTEIRRRPLGGSGTAGMDWPRGSLDRRIRRIREASRRRGTVLVTAVAAGLAGLAAVSTSVRAAPSPAASSFAAVEQGLSRALTELDQQPGIGGTGLAGTMPTGQVRVVLAVTESEMTEAYLEATVQHYLGNARAMTSAFARSRFLMPYQLTVSVHAFSLNGPVVVQAVKAAGSNQLRWEVLRNPIYPKNARGQTYGTDASVDVTTASNVGKAQPANLSNPELVLVQAANGKSGYVYATELNGPNPKNPQQAIALNSQQPRTIPVYAQNGTTVIGQFVVGGGTVTTSTSPSPGST